MNTVDYFPPSRLNPGRAWFVAPLSSDRSGLAWNTARNSVQSAIDVAASGDTIYIAPGSYDETVTIPANITVNLVGIGAFGSVKIEPTEAHADGLIVHGADCRIYNITAVSPDSTGSVACTVTGSGARLRSCRFEGAGIQLLVGPGADDDVNITIPTAGEGTDIIITDCQCSNGLQGVVLQGTDFGAAERVQIIQCLFDRLSASSIDETNDAGSAAEQFTNLLVKDCVFEPASDGTEPTAYILLNDNNANSGLVTGCRFTVALNSGKNLVSTACKWVGNYHPAGLSTTQPS